MKLTIDVPDNRIADMLCGAFEGGSNYWCRIQKYVAPALDKLFPWDTMSDRSIGDGDNPAVYKHVQYPMSPGGKVIVRDMEADEEGGKEYTLALDLIRPGLKAMATKEPRHFGDMMSGNDDATTADVFLQCCLFGEVVYG